MTKKEEEITKKKEERNLKDKRYDAKLFKQAYKAAKEAKELERKSKKKKNILRGLLFLVSTISLFFLIFFLLSLISKKPEYIEAYEPKAIFQNNIVEGLELDSPIQEDILINSVLSAESALVFDPDSGSTLFEKNSTQKRPIASLTKILSAIVVIENYDMQDLITVNLENIPEDLDWQLELKQGDKITVENILKSMLISSYNDASYIVANAYPYGGYDAFIKAMNRKSIKIRMVDSHFSNPAGLDDEMNYSTAQDIAKLIAVAKRYREITELVRLGEYTINWYSNGELESKKIFTTNQMYGVNSYVKGFKTGVTKQAKECFVGYFVYPNEQELITVVLGSEDRFADTKVLESYVRNNLLR